MIKRFLLLQLAFWSMHVAQAQVGISAGYSSFDKSGIIDKFDIPDPGDNHQSTGFILSVDYWFRLKQKRLEFLPTFYFTDYYSAYKIKNVGFQFRTTIYPFDFAGDCNCPTFSKENDLLKKGFFIRLSPGVGHWSTNTQSTVPAPTNDLDTWAAEISGALGLDFGLTNLLTISPEVRYKKTFQSKWNTQDNDKLNGLSIFEVALRIGLRFDKKNYGFKRPKRRRRR